MTAPACSAMMTFLAQCISKYAYAVSCSFYQGASGTTSMIAVGVAPGRGFVKSLEGRLCLQK